MRKATFIVFAIVIVACSPVEKVVETSRAAVLTTPDEQMIDGDSLYRILIREGRVSDSAKARVSVLTRHLVDVSEPDVLKQYVAVLVERTGVRTTLLAVFDAAQGMKVVAFTEQEFPDVMTYYHIDRHQSSGQGPDVIPHMVKLSDAGEAIALVVKSEKHFVHGSDDDEDVWLFGLWKDEIVMLMGYSRKFHHLVTGNGGWSEDTWSSKDLEISSEKHNGMYDILLKGKLKISSDTEGKNKETSAIEKHVFNGKEYVLD